MIQFRNVPISILRLDEVKNADAIPTRVQLMRTGAFSSEEYGAFDITPKILSDMLSNFKNKVRGVDLAIDYSHESESVAAGWIKDLFLAEDDSQLWAEVVWTPNGAKVLSDKEFRYLSADFTFDFVNNENNKKHGPTLFGAGLTNRPFIKNMVPAVALNEGKGIKQMDDKDKKIAELEAVIVDLKKQIDELEASEKKTEEASEVKEVQKTLDETKKKLMLLQESNKKLEEEKKLAEKNDSFNKLLKEGKAVEAQRQAFITNDALKFAELAQPVNLGGQGNSAISGGEKTASSKAEAEKQLLALAEGYVREKKVTNLSGGLRLALSENPELRKVYEVR